MTDGLKMHSGGFQQIGPDGLVTQHFPATPTVISLADVMEAVRWIHADLEQIHQAFKVVYTVGMAFEKASDDDQQRSKLFAEQVKRYEYLVAESVALRQELTFAHENITDRLTETESRIISIEAVQKQQADVLLVVRAQVAKVQETLDRRWWRDLWNWLHNLWR